MVSFVDLLPAARRTRMVPVLGTDIEVRSLKMIEIADLMWKFPEVRALIAERSIDADKLLAMAPRAAATAIAAATGVGDSEAEIDAIVELPPGSQAMLLMAVIELSAPDGLTPLLQALARMMMPAGAALAAGSGTVPAGNTQQPSSG